MAGTAIRAEGLGKRYRLGESGGVGDLRETLANALSPRARAARRREPEGSARSELWAIRDVSLEVAEGEVIGIVGRNGAGKSTLLKVLARITEPTVGRAEIEGRVASLLEVGTGFHVDLTGRENVFLNGAVLGMRKREIARKLDEIVEFAEVERFIDTPVKRYSTGMYMRLAFSVAAHLEPDVLIVDEVLAVGDAAFQKKCLGRMGDAARGGRTVIFVSHNMGAVDLLCDRAVYISGGRVRAVGPTADVVAQYLAEAFEPESAELERLRLQGMGRQARFVEIALRSESGESTAFGRPLRFALRVQSDADLAGLNVGGSIYNSLGVCVGSLITREEFAIEAGQELDLSLTARRLNLAPGTYHAAWSIGRGGYDGAREDLDVVVGSPVFQVLPLATEASPLAYWNQSWGSVVFDDVRLDVGAGAAEALR